MPFIVSRVNQKLNEKQIKDLETGYIEKLGRILGKPKNYIMLDFQDNCHLYAKGTDAPAAYIEANIYGGENPQGYSKLSEEITQMFEEIVGIPAGNIFINFQDVPGFSIDGTYV